MVATTARYLSGFQPRATSSYASLAKISLRAVQPRLHLGDRSQHRNLLIGATSHLGQKEAEEGFPIARVQRPRLLGDDRAVH